MAQAARFGRSDLSRAADLVADGLTEMRGATAPRLLLELICARVLLPGADDSTNGVLARLDRIEKRISIEGGVPSTSQHVGRPAAPAPVQQSPASDPASAATPDAQASRKPQAPTPAPTSPTPDLAPKAKPQAPTPESTQAPDPKQPSAPPPPTGTGSGSGLGLVEVRRLWPDLLESVKLKRRFTWIMLSQNAQVAAVDEKTLTIALLNPGARDSFLRSGSDEILRQAAIDVVGQDWQIDTIVDPSAKPGETPDAAPRTIRSAVREPEAAVSGGEPTDEQSSPSSAQPTAASSRPDTPADPTIPPPRTKGPVDPTTIATARGAIQPTRAKGPVGPKEPGLSDEAAHPDDPDADDQDLGGAQLLERELGARIIEEIKHD